MKKLYIIIFIIICILLTIPTFYNTILSEKYIKNAIDEKNNLYLGIIYFNPSDKRIILPKHSGLGITLNFAHPVAASISIFSITLLIFYIVKKKKKTSK